MKKLVLAAAIAAAMPVLAHADVTIYGSIRAGLDSMKSTDTSFKSSTGVDDFASRIGFKGNEDLGNGLKAIWQVETGMNVDGVPPAAPVPAPSPTAPALLAWKAASVRSVWATSTTYWRNRIHRQPVWSAS
jgi:hypothetical protein